MEQLLAFGRDALGLSPSIEIEVRPLAGRGSDRTYYRLKWNTTHSAILVHYDARRVENAYQADIARFLHDVHVPAPRLIRHDPALCLILVEDLGETDLWSLRQSPWETRRDLYRKTLAAAHTLHCLPEKDFPASRVRLMEPFGPDLYQWERNYFIDNFVTNVSAIGLQPSLCSGLEGELAALAARIEETAACLIHRDLQSQNVMVRGDEIFFIDFQGMRFGSPFYDLGSLLCDPYVDFSDGERDTLLLSYYDLGTRRLDPSTFRTRFWEASSQRLMQALGAYGFLGLKKGLTSYLRHIPAALRNLHLAASRASSLPLLVEVTELCQEAMKGETIRN